MMLSELCAIGFRNRCQCAGCCRSAACSTANSSWMAGNVGRASWSRSVHRTDRSCSTNHQTLPIVIIVRWGRGADRVHTASAAAVSANCKGH
jgi:hypothetical protein